MKKTILIAALGLSCLSSYAQGYTDRNSIAGCDSTCAATGNAMSTDSTYSMHGNPGSPTVQEKTIPVYVLDGSGGKSQNGTMLIRLSKYSNGTPYIEMVQWTKQYALSNSKNSFTFNANSFESITYVDVVNFAAGS